MLLGTSAVSGTGNELNNALTGNSASNRLTGGAGNDALNGMAGADTMLGGTGNDTYTLDSTSDVVTEYANEGTDTVRSPFAYTLGANVENLLLTGSASVNGAGNAGNNVLTGNTGRNTLSGAGGNDVLDGGAGVDTLLGGTGDDTYVVDQGGDVVLEGAAEGTDTVRASATFTLSANDENLTLTGTALVDGTGNTGTNILIGNVGANRLDGAAGADTMKGGAGDDTYIVDNVGDTIVENLNEGADTVISTVDYTLSANVENVTIPSGVGGSWMMRVVGNDLNNVITGNQYSNELIGLGGNDILDAGVHQSAFGGIDTLAGGTGSDTYLVVNTRSRVIEQPDEGVDVVYTTASFALGANVENIFLKDAHPPSFDANMDHYAMLWGDEQLAENYWEDVFSRYLRTTLAEAERLTYFDVWGNDLDNVVGGDGTNDWLEGNGGDDMLSGARGDDVLYGGAGDDTLDGGEGSDAMFGGPGNDTYVVDASDRFWRGLAQLRPQGVENANEGTDLVMSAGGFGLPANFENLTLTGAAAVDGYGNEGPNVIRGNAASNWIGGNVGADRLYGGAGNDFLVGHAGADAMYGEAGNDLLEGLEDNDTLIDASGNNLLLGGLGADALTGGAGRDFFAGGIGNDVISTSTGADIIAFNRGDGQDVLNASAGVDNTLSIGGGVRYTDMTLNKAGSDLLLGLGGSDSITLKGWYAAAANRSVLNLQVIAEAMADFDATSPDKLLNKKVVNFDFAGVTAAYDAAGMPANWALTNALLSRHLSSSDTSALGADLAYGYGSRGSLRNMGFDPVQGMLASGSFGISAQALQPLSALETFGRRLT